MSKLRAIYYFVFFLSFNSIKPLPIKENVNDESLVISDKDIFANGNGVNEVYFDNEHTEGNSEAYKDQKNYETVSYQTNASNNEDFHYSFHANEEQSSESREKRQDLLYNDESSFRPGMVVEKYHIEITPQPGTEFNGIATIEVFISDKDTIDDPIIFQMVDLEIESVQYSIAGGIELTEIEFNANNAVGILTLLPPMRATLYTFEIHYTGALDFVGKGLYRGEILDDEYIAMNLHPTNARKVFPCMDEPNLSSTILSLTFNDMEEFERVISNSQFVEDSRTTFRSLQGPVHRWAMVAHSMNILSQPVSNRVVVYARDGTENQLAMANLAINHYYNALNEWTGVEHNALVDNQDGGLHVMAVPDVAREWYGLSTLCVWEPYILMENNNAVKQRKSALVAIAEGMARQWFGWAIFPENWRDQWVIAGLASYAAYEIAKDFQTPTEGLEDPSLIDMNAIFTTDVIQESLLYDAYGSAQPLRLNDPIYNDNDIRQHTQGLLKTKAPAMLRMTRLVLSEERDLVQTGAQGLLRSRRHQWVTTRNLYDSLSSGYATEIGSDLIGSVVDFLSPWVENNGYPVISITRRRTGVQLSQERFGFSQRQQFDYNIPLTFTTSKDPDFDNVFPSQMMTGSMFIELGLGDDDWFIFNLQGQGYYRVNYEDTWGRLTEVLSDPETRDDIHYLNRATLLDDALNLARADKIPYNIPLEMTLTMELETEYAVWKAFVRNMEFIRKRLLPFVDGDDERDDNIYLRLIRKIIETVEEEIGFEPEAAEPAMVSLTRGLVMEHVCKVGYDPCIAAAVDIFYHPNNEGEVNPNIPPEIRPTVYCTMMRQDEEGEVRQVLENHLDEAQSRYERLVILESLACSEDEGFINTLLGETISDASSYNLVLEERLKIFAAVASSSFQNSGLALDFLIRNARPIRETYGGPEKLDEAIFIMAENIVTGGQINQFVNWMNSQNSISNLDDSMLAAERAKVRLDENFDWANDNLEEIYDWINENDASNVFVSTLLLCISMCIALYNQR